MYMNNIQNLSKMCLVCGDIFYRRIRDFMDEADVLVFARSDPGDDLTPCDFRIHDGLAAAAAVIDHHDKVLHVGVCPRRITKGSSMPKKPALLLRVTDHINGV